jgi:uncharacterized metal-binding protein YceD (DUF177 family)
MTADNRLTLYIDEIGADGGQYEGEVSPEVIDLSVDDLVCSEKPLHYALEASIVSEELLVQGSLQVELTMRCCRCSVFYPLEVCAPAYFYDEQIDDTTESVDLTGDMREAIILAFPSYPVCSSDCKGLCPQCGANKNVSDCNCKPPDEVRWAALDGLG